MATVESKLAGSTPGQVHPVVRHSCGNCRHFEDIGMKNWGNCLAPLPQWAQETVEHSGAVWRDGGNQDYAHECDALVPNDKAQFREERA